MEVYTLDEIKQAYHKLRSYIYHDNTDLFLRKQLVEFETGIIKKDMRSVDVFFVNKKSGKDKRRLLKVDHKLQALTDALNTYHEETDFFNELIEKIQVNYYPKKLVSPEPEKNFITNKKSKEDYFVDKVTPFINAPIELHIVSVLWIMYHGVALDAKLSDTCYGNRLILNKEKNRIVQGSGLFKPYFNQYTRWRDSALTKAKQLLNDNRDVAFVNLDIRDYFNSVRLPRQELYTARKDDSDFPEFDNLKRIFLSLHDHYTELLNPSPVQEKKGKRQIKTRDFVILPIGLVSSYVLANSYLQQFDGNINRHIKPAYYGRYVDDILFVISDPTHPEDLVDDEFQNRNESMAGFSNIERFIKESFHPVLDIVDDPLEANNRIIQLQGKKYNNLHCQSSKSLVYLFDAEESLLVIDKLKEDLIERTSEFRDFPDEDINKETFTDAAYHLQYEDSKEKIRTLKDYKEDRFGLTLFLANKIYCSLRQEQELSDESCDNILKFFRHKTGLEFYKLWEKVFTLFLVNRKAKHYVAFYLQCIQEIQQLKTNDTLRKNLKNLKESLAEYLDIANEITFSLNLAFYDEAFLATREFEFKTSEWQSDIFFSLSNYLPTKSDAFWMKRFRRANMIRHHYIIHPLLNYTIASRQGKIKNLVNPHINFALFALDEQMLKDSPRRVKYWECNMAQMFVELGKEDQKPQDVDTSSIFVLDTETAFPDIEDPFDSLELDQYQCLLNESYRLFQKCNQNHIPSYEWSTGGSASREKIYKLDSIVKVNSPAVQLNEIFINTDEKKEQFRIAFANTVVKENNIFSSIRGRANLDTDRIQRLGRILKTARKERADIILFPEFFIPVDLLSSVVDHCQKNDNLIITGLEHINVNNKAFNFIVTVLPFSIGGVKDAVVIPRLKNHYAHSESHIIEGYHYKVPKPTMNRYDLFIWKNLYFSTYYCFELANIHHRGLWKNKTDMIIGVEWNKDTPYYSNIVESTSRDLHCFFAQVNTSQYGDSRLTQPVESALKDILRLKGGTNDALLVASFGVKELREFQQQTYSLSHTNKEFKPLPPDFDEELVKRRVNNQSVLNY